MQATGHSAGRLQTPATGEGSDRLEVAPASPKDGSARRSRLRSDRRLRSATFTENSVDSDSLPQESELWSGASVSASAFSGSSPCTCGIRASRAKHRHAHRHHRPWRRMDKSGRGSRLWISQAHVTLAQFP
jgi:hypothetical protein